MVSGPDAGAMSCGELALIWFGGALVLAVLVGVVIRSMKR